VESRSFLRCVLRAAAVSVLVLTGCAAPAAPMPPADDQLAAVRRWGETVRSYRYERTALLPRPEGGMAVVHERGEVVLPDRQRLVLGGAAGSGEASREVIVVGDRAWVRQAVLGRGWQESPAETRPADPLTLALGTLAAAGPARPLGDRREEDGRLCQGWAYPFDPAAVAVWPAGEAGGALTAEASLWREASGALCAQTVRLQRDSQPAGEYTVTLRDINAPLTIEPPG
jgi:hypothetical protein